jgi:hypothetical protein
MLFRQHARGRDGRSHCRQLVLHAGHSVAFSFHHCLESCLRDVGWIVLLFRCNFVSSMSARAKKSVSVAPGIKHVTVTPDSFNSPRKAKENESMKAFVAL